MLIQKHNPNIERQIIGTFLNFPKTFSQFTMSPDDFYVIGHQEIYRAFQAKGVTDNIAAEAFSRFSSQPAVDLMEMREEGFSAHGLEPSIRYVQTDAAIRRFSRIIQGAEANVSDSDAPVREILRISQEIIESAGTGDDRHIGTEESFFDDAMEMTRLSPQFEVGLGPLLKVRNGQYISIGARPGCGKSSVALQIMLAASNRGRVLFYSMEMKRREVAHRILCQMQGFYAAPESAEAFEIYARSNSSEMLRKNQKFTICDNANLRIEDLWSYAAQLHAKERLSCVIVDYIGLVQAERMDRAHEKMAHVSTMIKRMAMDLDVPVFVCAQLRRENGDIPNLESYAGSDQIGRDSDQAWLIWTEHDMKSDEFKQALPVNISKEKNRGGDIGVIPFVFERPAFRFLPGW